MKKGFFKFTTALILFVFIFNLYGQVALACKQNYDNIKKQGEFLKTSISQITDGQEKMALVYDLEGLKSYKAAHEKLKSVSDVVYKDYSNAISFESDKNFIPSLLQDGIKIDHKGKIPTLNELLSSFETEINNQYVYTCWNTSDKLFEIKRDLSNYAVGLIYSGRCDNETVSLLADATKSFFMADKILCDTTINELENIISSTKDIKVRIKSTAMLKISEKMFENAKKHIKKGQVIPSAILYEITYEKLLETLKMCGFEYSKTMLEDERDSDGDGISDAFELIFGTNPFKADTDGDGLSDGIEFKISKVCSPTDYDTDKDRISDANEDSDNDGLINKKEAELGTDITNKDSDGDGLNDGLEVNVLKTDPLKYDTDEDGLSDGDEYKLGTNPLVPDSDNNGIPDSQEKFKQNKIENFNINISNEKNIVKNVTVNFKATGNAETSTVVENVYNKSISTNVVGRVSYPFDIRTTSIFDEAIVSFNYDENALGDIDTEDLGVLWFDEANRNYVLMDSTVDANNQTISFTTTHFSEYLLINKSIWFDSWRKELNYGRQTDDTGETQYYDIVLAIDSSGSMDWNDPDDLRKVAAKQFIDAFLPEDQGAVVDFDGSADILIHLTKSKDSIKTAIDTIDSSGITNIDAAINTGIDELISSYAKEENQKIIILLTDGEGDYYSSTTQRAINNKIKIYTVGLGSDVDEVLLETIAAATDGIYYQIASSDDLLDAFKRVQDDTIGEGDTTDTDGDGLPDIVEITGFRVITGEIIKTDPYNYDTDGDGLSDGEEVGKLTFATFASTQIPFDSRPYYNMISYPDKKDSDNDGYDDDIDIDPFVYNTPDEQEFIADDMDVDEEIFWSFAWGVVASAVENGLNSANDVATVVNSLFFGTQFASFGYISFSEKKEEMLEFIESKVTCESAYYFGKTVTDTILTVAGVIGTVQGIATMISGGSGVIASVGAEVFSGGTLTPAVAVSVAISLATTAVGAAEAGICFSLAKSAAGNVKKNTSKLMSSFGKKSNSQILRDNMKAKAKINPNFQKEPKYDNDAHHIVPATAKRAKIAREILKKFDIHFNDAENGVFLPSKAGIPEAAPASIHTGRHLNSYIDKITDMLQRANPQNKSDCIKVLDKIREMLLDGTLKLQK